MGIIEFSKDARIHNLIYGDPTIESIKEFNCFLKNSKAQNARLFHGTSSVHNITSEGLKPTSITRRHSYQSTCGFVYLSIFPGMARTFGEMAYPSHDKIIVYSVDLPISMLKADIDQLASKRYWAQKDMGNSLAESLIFGHGARVKGKIPPELITVCTDN